MEFPFDFENLASKLKLDDSFKDSAECHSFVDAFFEFLHDDGNLVPTMPSNRTAASVPLYRVVKEVTQNEDGTYAPAPLNRVMPDEKYTVHGRANFPGDAFLYLASEVETALRECRTQQNDEVTLSEFSVKETFYVVHLGRQLEFYRDVEINLSDPKNLKYKTWDQINKAFSEPIPDGKSPEDFYKPMQFIAQQCLLKADENIHGLFFESSVSSGTNYVLFDYSRVEHKCSKPIKVNCVKSFDYTDLPQHT